MKASEGPDEKSVKQTRWFYALFLSPILVFTGIVAIGYARLSGNFGLVKVWYISGVFLVIPISLLTHIGLNFESKQAFETTDRRWRYLGSSFILGAILFIAVAAQRSSLFNTPIKVIGGYIMLLNISVIPSILAYLYERSI